MISDSSSTHSFTRVGKLLRVSTQSKLKKLAIRLERDYGPPKLSSGQPINVLEAAAKKLSNNNSNLDALSLREKKASIELFWLKIEGWEAGKKFRKSWLGWAEESWLTRSGVRRIAMSAVRNYSSDSDASVEVLDWLSIHKKLISGNFGEFFRNKGLYSGYPSIEKIAKRLATGNTDLFDELSNDLRLNLVVRGSGFLVSVIDAYGAMLTDGKTLSTRFVILKLIELLGENGLSGARGSERLRNQARVSLVEGLVSSATSKHDISLTTDMALELIISIAGDPRISRSNWRDIKNEVREEVESWLTERTIENVFKVIGSLKTDRPDMVVERLKFWRSYLPYIKRAYLLCASKAVPIADMLNEKFGFLDNTEIDHCGMLLQLVGPNGDKLTVLMLNKNAKALFWTANSKHTPILFDGRYNRRAMMTNRSHELVHYANIWQSRFADYIESETGIRRPIGFK